MLQKLLEKTAEATGDLIGNKIADKITSICKPKEIEEIYIPSEKRNKLLMTWGCFKCTNVRV